MQLRSDSFAHGGPIPARCAFGQPGSDGPFAFGGNASPHLAWSGAHAGTRSFALVCIDTDVPSRGDDVNRSGHTVPADLPRVEFAHWLMVDIAPHFRELDEGACGRGIVARGKRQPPGPAGARQGCNDYTGWFAGDAEMAGRYLGYDGPCPPWNDSLVHHYHFRLYALDVPRLTVPEGFDWPALRAALAGHVLAEAACVGTYSMNPAVPA